eukprot:3818270-Amphidinium_carterae.1
MPCCTDVGKGPWLHFRSAEWLDDADPDIALQLIADPSDERLKKLTFIVGSLVECGFNHGAGCRTRVHQAALFWCQG